jgi:hypothetical protein
MKLSKNRPFLAESGTIGPPDFLLLHFITKFISVTTTYTGAR